MKKNIVIIYSTDDWNKKKPFSKKSKETRLSFEDWYKRAEKYNMKFYRASIKWLDESTGTFSKAWTFENNEWKKVMKPIKAHAIYDKTVGKNDYITFDKKMSIQEKVPMLNNPLFRTITNNKLSQYMFFGEYMPKTLLANNKQELSDTFSDIKSSKVVIKPLHGSGGFGIFIGKKSDALKKRLTYPVIVQEFITSTKGIPGFSQKDEVADLRLVYTDHKLVYALSRIAQKGSLFTNFHQGATAVLVPKNKIPKSVQKMSKNIIKKLSLFNQSHYSLDFIFDDNKKPILVEMNTTPGFDLLRIVGTERIKKLNFELFVKSINKLIG